MNTLPLYTRTIFAFLTLILSLSLIQGNYNAFADETSKCDKARTLLAKLQSREKGFTNEKEKWEEKRGKVERYLNFAERYVLMCNETPPKTDKWKKKCSAQEESLKDLTKTMHTANKQLKWIESQLVEIRSNQKRLRATLESNNCNGDTEVLAEEENGEEVEDPSGTWIVNLNDGYATYKIEWEISKSGQGVWTINQTLLATTHSHNKRYIGKKAHSYTLTSKDGSYRFEGASSSTVPGNPGHFTQDGTLSFSGDSISGSGTHHGTKITHDFTFSGSKK